MSYVYSGQFVQLGLTRMYLEHIRRDREAEFTPDDPSVLSFWKATHRKFPLIVAPIFAALEKYEKTPDGESDPEIGQQFQNWLSLYRQMKRIASLASGATSFLDLADAISTDAKKAEVMCLLWQSTLRGVPSSSEYMSTLLEYHTQFVNPKSPVMEKALSAYHDPDSRCDEFLNSLKTNKELQICMDSRTFIVELYYGMAVSPREVLDPRVLKKGAAYLDAAKKKR